MKYCSFEIKCIFIGKLYQKLQQQQQQIFCIKTHPLQKEIRVVEMAFPTSIPARKQVLN